MKSPIARVRAQAGMSIIEVLVAGAVGMIIILAMASAMKDQGKTIQGMRIASTRDNLKNLIQKYLSDPTTVGRSLSLTGNESFKACLQGGTTPGCATAPCCNNGFSGSGQPFVLLDPAVPNPSPTPTTGVLFSGPPASPQRYDINGAKCGSPGPACPFVLATSFTAVCPGGTDPCPQAQNLTVEYSLAVAPGVTLASGPPLAASAASVPVLGAGGAAGSGVLSITQTFQLGDGSFTFPPNTVANSKAYVRLVGGSGGSGGNSFGCAENGTGGGGGGGGASCLGIYSGSGGNGGQGAQDGGPGSSCIPAQPGLPGEIREAYFTVNPGVSMNYSVGGGGGGGGPGCGNGGGSNPPGSGGGGGYGGGAGGVVQPGDNAAPGGPGGAGGTTCGTGGAAGQNGCYAGGPGGVLSSPNGKPAVGGHGTSGGSGFGGMVVLVYLVTPP